jgi:hypothetical protein
MSKCGMTLTVRFRDESIGVGFTEDFVWNAVRLDQPVPKDNRPVAIEEVQFTNDFGFVGWRPQYLYEQVCKERDELKAQLAQALREAKRHDVEYLNV